MHLWYIQRSRKNESTYVLLFMQCVYIKGRGGWEWTKSLWKNNVSLSKRRVREVDLARDTFSSGFITVNVWHQCYTLCYLKWERTSINLQAKKKRKRFFEWLSIKMRKIPRPRIVSWNFLGWNWWNHSKYLIDIFSLEN